MSNLLRTLKTMSRYGLVRLEPGARGAMRPEMLVTALQVDLPLVG